MFHSDIDFFFLIPEHFRNEEYCDCYEVVIIFYKWNLFSHSNYIPFFKELLLLLKVLSYSRENINYV